MNLNFQVSKFRYQSKPLHRVTRPYNTLQHIKMAKNVTKQKEKKAKQKTIFTHCTI